MTARRFRLQSALAIILILSVAVVMGASNAYASPRGGIGVDDGGCGGGGGNGSHGGGGGGNLPPHPGNQPIPGQIPSRITHLNQLGIKISC
ncbi:MAG: hypothetical protein ACHQ03_01245 [Candidatus Bathyarchaeia archaeon]